MVAGALILVLAVSLGRSGRDDESYAAALRLEGEVKALSEKLQARAQASERERGELAKRKRELEDRLRVGGEDNEPLRQELARATEALSEAESVWASRERVVHESPKLPELRGLLTLGSRQVQDRLFDEGRVSLQQAKTGYADLLALDEAAETMGQAEAKAQAARRTYVERASAVGLGDSELVMEARRTLALGEQNKQADRVADAAAAFDRSRQAWEGALAAMAQEHARAEAQSTSEQPPGDGPSPTVDEATAAAKLAQQAAEAREAAERDAAAEAARKEREAAAARARAEAAAPPPVAAKAKEEPDGRATKADAPSPRTNLAALCKAEVQPDIPDPASATLDEMKAAQAAVKGFEEAYRKCLDAAAEASNAAAPTDEPEDDKNARLAAGVALYNASIDRQTALAEKYNAAARAFKEARSSEASKGRPRDWIPLVRVPPVYPSRAVRDGVEGWVIVEFTVTATGAVKDAKAVDSKPAGVFDAAAVSAVSQWRYTAKTEGSHTVETQGVRTIVRFDLQD